MLQVFMIRAALQHLSYPWLDFYIKNLGWSELTWRNVELTGACFMACIFDLSSLPAILGILLAASDPGP